MERGEEERRSGDEDCCIFRTATVVEARQGQEPTARVGITQRRWRQLRLANIFTVFDIVLRNLTVDGI